MSDQQGGDENDSGGTRGGEDMWGKALARHLQETTSSQAQAQVVSANYIIDTTPAPAPAAAPAASANDEEDDSSDSGSISITSSTRSAAQFWLDSIDNRQLSATNDANDINMKKRYNPSDVLAMTKRGSVKDRIGMFSSGSSGSGAGVMTTTTTTPARSMNTNKSPKLPPAILLGAQRDRSQSQSLAAPQSLSPPSPVVVGVSPRSLQIQQQLAHAENKRKSALMEIEKAKAYVDEAHYFEEFGEECILGCVC